MEGAVFMLVSRMFAALHLCVSDTEWTHARRAGIGQLRHKSRHSGPRTPQLIEAPEKAAAVNLLLPLP
jgi:hypothetical protein